MGKRWSINQYGGITRDGCFLAHNEIPVTANADCDAYEARIAELETMLAGEVADNARLRARDVGDEVGNVLCELADANNRIAELEALSSTKLASEIIVKMAADIQALRAELARVKAESLRVVEVGEARHPEKGAYHCLYENGGVLAIHYGENEMFFLSDNPGFAKLSKHADAFTPVRLERWEMEDGN